MPLPELISSPIVTAHDPRGLTVRTARYYRARPGERPAERIERTCHDATGAVLARYDARSIDHDLPVRRASVALGAAHVWSADAGDAWRLNADTGAPLWALDATGIWQETVYDAAGRPVMRREADSLVSRCHSLLSYGQADAWEGNLAGAAVLVLDDAGRFAITRIALTGQVQGSVRELLSGDGDPDWAGQESLEAPAATIATFDALGALLTLTDAAGHTQDIVRGVDGRTCCAGLTVAGGKRLSLTTALHYGASGEPLTHRLGNGVVRSWTYDGDDGRLLGTTLLRDAIALQRLRYTYDPAGNILSIVDTAAPIVFHGNAKVQAARAYVYDAFHQLVEATGREHASASHGPDLPDLLPITGDPTALRPYVHAYAYDAGGNLVRHGAQTFTVAPLSNRSLPASVTADPDEVDRHFDAAGQMNSLYPGAANLQWGSRRRLRMVTTLPRIAGESDRELYLYDGNSQRLRKRWRHKVAGSVRVAETLYLGPLERHQDEVTGERHDVVTIALGAGTVRVMITIDGSIAIRYRLADHLGSTSLELDESGLLASCEEYYPFGGTAWHAATSQQEADWRTVRYSGKERDATGLYDYGFRYYAPWLARWISPDPAGDIDGLNRYGMVRNNPVTRRDADGRVGGMNAYWSDWEDIHGERDDLRPGALWDDDEAARGSAGGYFDASMERRLTHTDDMSEGAGIMTDARKFMHITSEEDATLEPDQIDSMSMNDADNFTNEYGRREWTFKVNFKRSKTRRYFANDVARYQYRTISQRNEFFGLLPTQIRREHVINQNTLRLTEGLPSHSAQLRETFLERTANGKTTQRILDDFGMVATSVVREEIPLHPDEPDYASIDFVVHVKPALGARIPQRHE